MLERVAADPAFAHRVGSHVLQLFAQVPVTYAARF